MIARRRLLRRGHARTQTLPVAMAAAVIGLIAYGFLGCAGLGLGSQPAWLEAPPPVKHAPVVQAGALTRAELDNGLTVLILEDRRLPRVSLGVTVRRGAGAVDPSQAGLAEFTSEMMNRGAGARDAAALAEAVDDMGASLSVGSDWDSMGVAVGGLSEDFDALLEILRDVARSPRFDSAEAEKARAEHLAGLEAARDDPATLAQWAAMRVLYPGHRYGLPLEGTTDTVKAFDAAAARELHARYFVAGNAIVSVSGDVDAGVVLARLRSVFGDWPRGSTPAQTPAPPDPTPNERRIVIADKPDLVQARILITHEGLARTDDRRIPASVMNATLGGSGFSSRMMQTLRSDAGLTYSVGSGFSLRRRPGPFVVASFTRVPETRRAVDILLAELVAIRSTKPQTARELAEAKSYLVGQFGLGLETSEAVMQSLVDLSVYGLPDDSLDDYRARVDAVTIEQTAAVARDLLHPSRAAIVLLGPADALVPQMEGLGTPVVVSP